MRKEEWKEGEDDQGGDMVQDRRMGDRQPGQRPVVAAQEGHHRRAVRSRSTSRSATTTRPAGLVHNRVEGSTEYTQLLYIPAKAPMDLWNREKTAGVKLYVKRVFIMDDAEALMPVYLRFVKGVIDSADLPLNVSRELLQESRDVKRHPRGQHQARAVDAGRPGQAGERTNRRLPSRRGQGQVRRVLVRVRRRAQGRPGRGLRQPRAHRQAAALRVHQSDTSACHWPTTRRA
jgi:hypothetical protein